MEVPVGLRLTGIYTPNDVCDGVRLVAIICDTGAFGVGSGDGVFDTG